MAAVDCEIKGFYFWTEIMGWYDLLLDIKVCKKESALKIIQVFWTKSQTVVIIIVVLLLIKFS